MRRLLRLTLLALALAAPLAAEQWGFWDYGPGAFGDQAWKEPVADAAALPASGNEIGDVRVTLDDLAAHVWDGDSWEAWAGGGGGSGTVTSVALAVPAEWTVSGSPVTGAGTITIAEATQTANTVYAGPTTGTAAAPGFRALVDDDLPAAALADDQAATEVPYTPTTASDWTDPDPTHAGEALDALAARLTTEEGKADDDVPESGDFGAAADLEADGSLSADVVAPAEMADADHGDVSWSGGVATVDSGAVGLTELADDAACTGGQATRRNAGDTAFECYTPAAGGIGGSTGATDNILLRSDGTGAATLQASDISLPDATGGVVTLATTAGNALAITATAPTATTGASQVGKAASLTASNAVASTDTAGAAAGGAATISGGNAARNTSGNANGGPVDLIPGTGIGTGTRGMVRLFGSTSSDVGFSRLSDIGSGYAGLGVKKGDGSAYDEVWANGFHEDGEQVTINSVGLYLRTNITGILSTGGTHANNPSTYETGLISSSAGIWSAFKSSTSIPAPILQSVLVEANTAGSGSPNVLAANESGTCETNEGATAKNYQTLPSAAAGYRLCFYIQDADGMRVTAASGDTIRIIDKVTAAAGYIESTTIGSMVVLVSLNATEWFGGPVHGTWTDGTFTFDDTGLTTP